MSPDEQLAQRFAQQEQELRVQQTELEQQNEELRQINLEVELAHNRYADLFEFAPVGYVICDQVGLIEQINRVGCEQLGTVSSQLLGRQFSLFVDPRQRGTFTELLHRTFRTPAAEHGHQQAELRLVRRDGSRWDAQLECAALAGPRGLLARMVLTDVSALKRLQRETEHQAAENRLLTTELQSILRAMTHDLTRPLRQVVGFAELLGKTLEAPDAASARHLRHLLLAASNMETLTASLTEFFESSLLDQIFSELEPQTRGRQITLTHAPLPILKSDRQGLYMVLSHLLANAVKFTASCPEARIHVDVTSTAEYHLFSV